MKIITDGFQNIMNSFSDFQGTGLIFVLFLAAMIYVAFSGKSKYVKAALVKYPIYVLVLFFCPLWYLYMAKSSDYEILYRLLWLLPMSVTVCYALTEVASKFGEKKRPFFFGFAVILIIISGEFVYGSEYFTKAENEYHVPNTVIEICDEIIVPGREIRAAFPDELMVYVRQYTDYVFLPYGRDTLFDKFGVYSELRAVLNEDTIDTGKAVEGLRNSSTPYLIVHSTKKFSESLSSYNFVYVTTIDDYDIYLDNEAYIGIDFENFS